VTRAPRPPRRAAEAVYRVTDTVTILAVYALGLLRCAVLGRPAGYDPCGAEQPTGGRHHTDTTKGESW